MQEVPRWGWNAVGPPALSQALADLALNQSRATPLSAVGDLRRRWNRSCRLEAFVYVGSSALARSPARSAPHDLVGGVLWCPAQPGDDVRLREYRSELADNMGDSDGVDRGDAEVGEVSLVAGGDAQGGQQSVCIRTVEVLKPQRRALGKPAVPVVAISCAHQGILPPGIRKTSIR